MIGYYALGCLRDFRIWLPRLEKGVYSPMEKLTLGENIVPGAKEIIIKRLLRLDALMKKNKQRRKHTKRQNNRQTASNSNSRKNIGENNREGE